MTATGTRPMRLAVTGIPTSSHSQKKVALEWLLDQFEARNGTTVSRIRPTLAVQPEAAAAMRAGRSGGRPGTSALDPGRPAWRPGAPSHQGQDGSGPLEVQASGRTEGSLV